MKTDVAKRWSDAIAEISREDWSLLAIWLTVSEEHPQGIQEINVGAYIEIMKIEGRETFIKLRDPDWIETMLEIGLDYYQMDSSGELDEMPEDVCVAFRRIVQKLHIALNCEHRHPMDSRELEYLEFHYQKLRTSTSSALWNLQKYIQA